MATSRWPVPPQSFPGYVGFHLPAFKRKRIERWCEDVAQYLREGSLCRSVITQVPEDNQFLCSGVKPCSSASFNAHTSSSMGTIPARSSANNFSQDNPEETVANNNNDGTCLRVTKIDIQNAHSGTHMPEPSSSLPVTKYSYKSYSEQRRRTERLTQGLPAVIVSIATERSARADISTSGQDQVRSATLPQRPNKSAPVCPNPGVAPKPASRSSSVEHPALCNLRPAGHLLRRPLQLLTTTLPRPQTHPRLTTPHLYGLQPSKSPEIMVIEDEQDVHNLGNNPTAARVSSTNFEGNLGPKARSRSPNVHKARERMLFNTRSREHNLVISGQVTPITTPIQKGWTMAELTR